MTLHFHKNLYESEYKLDDEPLNQKPTEPNLMNQTPPAVNQTPISVKKTL